MVQGVSELQGGLVPTLESLKLPACQGTKVDDFVFILLEIMVLWGFFPKWGEAGGRGEYESTLH